MTVSEFLEMLGSPTARPVPVPPEIGFVATTPNGNSEAFAERFYREYRQTLREEDATLINILLDETRDPPPIGEFSVEIQLDQCWREGCGKPIDREDDLGLCEDCKRVLAEL
jgi:hypothetical protein